jgi:methylthioribose-1-phosphate isomerase
MEYLVSARPTAVNIADAAEKLKFFCDNLKNEVQDHNEYKQKLLNLMSDMLHEDVSTNKLIGEHGAKDILNKWSANNKS